jgi:hypothetical protein
MSLRDTAAVIGGCCETRHGRGGGEGACVVRPSMRVEHAPLRRESVVSNNSRTARAAQGGREQRPGPSDGVEREQVAEPAC